MKNVILALFTFTFMFTFTFTFAQGKRKQLKICQEALKRCYCDNDIKVDTIVVYKGKQAVKINKQNEKTKRKENTQETKQKKTEQKNKTKRNFVFQFFSSIKSFIRSLTIGQLVAGGAGASGFITLIMGFAEKHKPISSTIDLFRKFRES